MTFYSDSRVTEYGQSCDQMYIKFRQRVVQNSEGYRYPRNTVVGRCACMKSADQQTCPEYVHSEQTHEKTDVLSLPP